MAATEGILTVVVHEEPLTVEVTNIKLEATATDNSLSVTVVTR